MAFAFSVTGVENLGNIKMVHGTFTTAAHDVSATLTATTHGLNYIAGYQILFDTGGLDTNTPKVTVSSGTLTISCNDTEGYSGKWWVMGK